MLKFFRLPFATTGDKTAVPDAVDSSGNVSYSQGYGFDYQRQKTDPAAKNIERDKMNQILFDITTAIAEIQSKGGADFITSALNGGTAYSYGQGAIVNYSGAWYISLVAANTALPSNATKWALLPTPALLQQAAYMSAAAGGTVDAITAAFTPAIAALPAAPGTLSVFVRATGANATTTPTFKADGTTAKTIVKGANQALVAGDIAGAGHWLELQYDATLDKWVLQNPATGVNSFAQMITALPYPTVGSADLCLTVTSAIVGGTGGTVSIGAGTTFTLGEGHTASLGQLRTFTTPAWTSANLTANTTYYLRAQVVGGALTFYVQGGTDSDAIPGNFIGTPNAGTGGGFDSTQLDMLIAKVVTGANGTAPTVTKLANRYLLTFSSLYTPTLTTDGSGGVTLTYSSTINWARTPKVTASLGYDITSLTISSALDRCYMTQTVSRYTLSWNGYYDIFASVSGNIVGQLNAFGVA